LKVVIAPQGFKGNLTALEVARAIESGVRRVLGDVETSLVPMADGGEGTMQALVDALGGELIKVNVTGPLGEPVWASWGRLADGVTAVIEMAEASGLGLVAPEKRNPLVATTYGTGELIKSALERGCRRFIIGIGGSATNDGGAGVAQALGVRLLGAQGQELPFGGAALANLARIDRSNLDARLAGAEVNLACDVDNPLCGAHGASAVYGPQKGATPEMVVRLDAALAHYAAVIKRDLGVDIAEVAGAGAAGGLGAGLMVFLKARLRPGIDVIIEATHFTDHLKGADLVFTGEGRIDGQTACGKTPVGVSRRAKELGLPVIAIAGEIGGGYQSVYEQGITSILSIAPGPISYAQSLERAGELISDTSERAMRLFLSGRNRC
jgi:glycerate kinase